MVIFGLIMFSLIVLTSYFMIKLIIDIFKKGGDHSEYIIAYILMVVLGIIWGWFGLAVYQTIGALK